MICMSKNGGRSGVTPKARQVESHPTLCSSANNATVVANSPSVTTVPDPILGIPLPKIMFLRAHYSLASGHDGGDPFNFHSNLCFTPCDQEPVARGFF